MKNRIYSKYLLRWAAFLLLATFTGSIQAADTIFPGGTLDDLRQLSANLTFDHLIITGRLNLPLAGSATLNVSNLTITASGSISYNYGTCDWRPAPDLTVEATGQVLIEGKISLYGRAGTRVTSGAGCNSCYGQPGGDVDIRAGSIVLRSQIENHGGSGSTSVSSGCSSGCSAGDAGAINLQAVNITLTNASINTRGGNGGHGICFGNDSYGADGDPGTVGIVASNQFDMSQSGISTDGTLNFTAAQTNIYGPITYDQLNESINGQTDTTGPQIEILSPLPNAEIPIDDSFDIRIQLSDSGIGVKEVQITGLGHSQIHSGQEIQNGILEVTLLKPTTPTTLHMTGWDNKGNSTSASISGIRLVGSLTIPAGQTYYLDDDLGLGSESSIHVLGDLIIKRGSNPTITTGNLIIAESGRIFTEDPDGDLQTQAPSLTINVAGYATIDGAIDLSGHRGLYSSEAAWKNDGENGGGFTLTAASITVSGNIRSNGGNAVRYEYGWPAKDYGGAGGKGGSVSLNSSIHIGVSGMISATGGNSVNYYPSCYAGAEGGNIRLFYGSRADVSEASFTAQGGTATSAFQCTPTDGAAGSISGSFGGNPNANWSAQVNEVEANNTLEQAQLLFFPVGLSGSVTPDDTGSITLGEDDLEDVFKIGTSHRSVLRIELNPDASDVDLDLIFADSALNILDHSLSTVPGATEIITEIDIPAGIYLVFVSQWGSTPQNGSAYTLSIKPTWGPDSDGDGLSDWWEETHFGDLGRNGSLDLDNDGLSDKKEQQHGTYPGVPDTDGDGMPDGWEADHRLKPLIDDAVQDPDGDGFSNLDEYHNGTDPNPISAMPWIPLLLLDD